MKASLFAILPLLAVVCLAIADDSPKVETPADKVKAAPAPARKLETDEQKAGYALGYRFGERTFSQFGTRRIDIDALVDGVEDALRRKRSSLNGREIDAAVVSLRKKLQDDQATAYQDAIDNNKARGAAFLKENKTKKGVVTLPSGAQYIVLKEGTGKTPKATSDVEVHYHGTLIDGTVFDSSVDRGESVSFAVSGVIAGWTEILQLMKEGSKWRVFLPPHLAYGHQGSGRHIGPFAVLIFDIELIKVK